VSNKFFLNKRNIKFFIILVLFILSLFYFVGLLTPRKMMYGSDWLLSGYTGLQSWVGYFKSQLRLPMWDEYNFSGHPTVTTSGGGGMVYPLNIIYFIFPIHLGWTIMFIIHVFLAGFGMFLLLREYKLSYLASLLGAISFMFAGQLITTTHGGHLGRMVGVVFLPFAFLFLHRALRTERLKDFLIFGGVTGLFLLAGHTQITYWGMIGVILYFIYEVIRRRDELGGKGFWKLSGGFIGGIIILLFIASIKLLPPAFSLKYGVRGAVRGYQYTTSWSLPTSELFNLFVPHFSGILKNYWGENYFKLDSRYLGILPLILAGFAFSYKRERHLLKYFAWFTGVTLILALGKNTPIFKVYYYLVPMAKNFRAPSMFFFLTTFGIAVLSGFGAETLISLIKQKNIESEKKALRYLFVFVGLVFLATLIVNIIDQGILDLMKGHFEGVWSGLLPQNSIQQKISLMSRNFTNFKKSLWLSTLLFIIYGSLIYTVIKRKVSYKIIFPILGLILLIDQWSVDRKYLSPVERPEQYFAPDRITKFIAQDKGLFRVYPLNYERGNSGYLQYNGIENVGGYGPNPPKRYQEFIGAGKGVIFEAPNFFKFPYLLRMLNVKYIIAPRLPEDLSPYPESIKNVVKQYRDFYSNFEVCGKGERYEVLVNKNFLPRVSLLYQYAVVDSGKEALNRILSSEFEPGRIAILEGNPGISLSEGKGSIEVERYHSNERIFRVTTDSSAFFIFRENYHPDWKCFIDGSKKKIYKANYIFYGVFVPEGEHKIRFVYKSRIFNIASSLSFIGFLIFLTALSLSITKFNKSN